MLPAIRNFFLDQTAAARFFKVLLALVPIFVASSGNLLSPDHFHTVLIINNVFLALALAIPAGNKNSDPAHTVPIDIVSPPAPPKGFARIGLLLSLGILSLLGLSLAGCVASWTAAEKAAPACYGMTSADLGKIADEGKRIVLDAVACTGNVATCSSKGEDALGIYLANYDLNKQAFLCVTEAIKIEIAYPEGGEPAYAPDAGVMVAIGPATGPTTALTKPTGVDHSLALYRATQLTPHQQAAIDSVTSLQSHTNF
jgi:hypothetical protein